MFSSLTVRQQTHCSSHHEYLFLSWWDSALQQFLYIKVLTIKTGAHALRRVICERKLISMQTFQHKKKVVVSASRHAGSSGGGVSAPRVCWVIVAEYIVTFIVSSEWSANVCACVCVCNFCGHSRRCAEEKLRRLALWHLWRSDGDRCDRRRGGFKIYLYVRACACA